MNSSRTVGTCSIFPISPTVGLAPARGSNCSVPTLLHHADLS
ncbi:hypothetical protein [Sphingomonas sp.]|nr:hypothetical protein [Sphingomonas sp.]